MNTNSYFQRILALDLPKRQSAFLWGARKTGKSTILKHKFPEAYYIDLLKSDVFLKYLNEPSRLREELLAQNPKNISNIVIIDEVQKVPELLDEIHWLIENTQLQFILCGSSARKLRQKGVNLLGGRAWRFHFFPLVYAELCKNNNFDLLRVLNRGCIPSHYTSTNVNKSIQSYVQDYLIEEIKDEGVVRNLRNFSKFLESSSFSNGEQINYSNIARDSGIDSKTVKEYFAILEDTLIGSHIYPFSYKSKRAVLSHTPKFYFFDLSVVNYFQNRELKSLSGAETGHNLETYLYHEIKAYLTYNEKREEISYWRTSTGQEIDFIIGKAKFAIEVKISNRVRHSDTKGLYKFLEDYPDTQAILVCGESKARIVENEKGQKITVIPIEDFLKRLWSHELL